MDIAKTGLLIRDLRTKMGMTQKSLADLMNISDKTVSKWERGMGLPDVSLLVELSQIFGVNVDILLTGSMNVSDEKGVNMKNAKYYVCPECRNLVFATGDAEISCCGRKLTALEMKKAEPDEKLSVEIIENDWYITTSHPMTKEHYISFVAFATGEKIEMIKTYPEWDMNVRIQKRGHGKLVWYCTNHGLFYQLI